MQCRRQPTSMMHRSSQQDKSPNNAHSHPPSLRTYMNVQKQTCEYTYMYAPLCGCVDMRLDLPKYGTQFLQRRIAVCVHCKFNPPKRKHCLATHLRRHSPVLLQQLLEYRDSRSGDFRPLLTGAHDFHNLHHACYTSRQSQLYTL